MDGLPGCRRMEDQRVEFCEYPKIAGNFVSSADVVLARLECSIQPSRQHYPGVGKTQLRFTECSSAVWSVKRRIRTTSWTAASINSST